MAREVVIVPNVCNM